MSTCLIKDPLPLLLPDDVRRKRHDAMQVFFIIAYIALGFLQLFAVADGIEYGLHIGGFVGMMLALFLAPIPLVGSLVASYGAMHAWHWGLLKAAAVFFGPISLLLLGGAAGGRGERE